MTHLVLGDAPRRGVGAQRLQWVNDLPPRADGDDAVQQSIQMVDAGILAVEKEDGKEEGQRWWSQEAMGC